METGASAQVGKVRIRLRMRMGMGIGMRMRMALLTSDTSSVKGCHGHTESR